MPLAPFFLNSTSLAVQNFVGTTGVWSSSWMSSQDSRTMNKRILGYHTSLWSPTCGHHLVNRDAPFVWFSRDYPGLVPYSQSYPNCQMSPKVYRVIVLLKTRLLFAQLCQTIHSHHGVLHQGLTLAIFWKWLTWETLQIVSWCVLISTEEWPAILRETTGFYIPEC